MHLVPYSVYYLTHLISLRFPLYLVSILYVYIMYLYVCIYTHILYTCGYIFLYTCIVPSDIVHIPYSGLYLMDQYTTVLAELCKFGIAVDVLNANTLGIWSESIP